LVQFVLKTVDMSLAVLYLKILQCICLNLQLIMLRVFDV